jgi:hypothetical protein
MNSTSKQNIEKPPATAQWSPD